MNNKTVVDAVNALHGDLEFAAQGDHGYPYLLMDIGDGSYWLSIMDKKSVESGKLYRYICTAKQFNQCVAEMSEGLFVPDCRPKQPEIQYDKDGNGWEVGSMYEFSDFEKWYADTFVGFTGGNYPIESKSGVWMNIREFQSPIGKIHKKPVEPVELVDGAAYQFELEGIKKFGIWHNEIASFFDNFSMPMSEICTQSEAKNIIRLVPEVKL